MRKEFFSLRLFDCLETAQRDLDGWVEDYNTEREHQAIGDVAPVRRFELARPSSFEVIDGEVAIDAEQEVAKKVVGRRVDSGGRIKVLKHRYHVGVFLDGQTVSVESKDGLLHVTHNGVVVATHARRHNVEDDPLMEASASLRSQ